jgi:hypothetical protein
MQERLASGDIQCFLVSGGILLGSSWAKMSRLTVPLNPLRGSLRRLRSPGETADQLKHRDAALESRALHFRDRGRPILWTVRMVGHSFLREAICARLIRLSLRGRLEPPCFLRRIGYL